MGQCNPHAWRTPLVGDAVLVCDVCEHRMDLAHDITADVQAEILSEYRRHYGPIVGGHFEEGAGGCSWQRRGSLLSGRQPRIIGGRERVA